MSRPTLLPSNPPTRPVVIAFLLVFSVSLASCGMFGDNEGEDDEPDIQWTGDWELIDIPYTWWRISNEEFNVVENGDSSDHCRRWIYDIVDVQGEIVTLVVGGYLVETRFQLAQETLTFTILDAPEHMEDEIGSTTEARPIDAIPINVGECSVRDDAP